MKYSNAKPVDKTEAETLVKLTKISGIILGVMGISEKHNRSQWFFEHCSKAYIMRNFMSLIASCLIISMADFNWLTINSHALTGAAKGSDARLECLLQL